MEVRPHGSKLLGDFRPGRIYELTYAARDPMIVGLGMAGIRNLLSYLRLIPLTGVRAPQRTLIFGISQFAPAPSDHVVEGADVDEAGRPVFDGAFLHVAAPASLGGTETRCLRRRPSQDCCSTALR